MSDTVKKHREFLFPAVAMYYKEPLALVRGEGMHVWDEAGDKYLDCFGGVLTVSVGHANPAVVKAEVEQISRLQHTSTLYANHNHADLAEKMAEITPGRLKKSFFSNTGTEADDTAILAAKMYTKRHEIIVLRQATADARRRRFPQWVTLRGGPCRPRSREWCMPTRRTVTAARSG